ncbi:TetR/AcrR family transcriptional regulator C-terminal domain-containing protein [Streptomyces sp. GESEQ-4]|uniref:TetR/AcrR family transcriptional regulator C-terminal domain-containing protein n=1 Tax=Streptomyces sp. GESEQ-4 TaxID=2812655 RepID=UPI0027DD4BC3|nr:TetR/AcrR family transcriptional regulator C-terminal domain-containing protein [Streptomyces sp. GESEQ-4]
MGLLRPSAWQRHGWQAGLLDLHGGAPMAGVHFMALVSHSVVQRSHHGVRPLPPGEADRMVTRGAAAFLRAYRAG